MYRIQQVQLISFFLILYYFILVMLNSKEFLYYSRFWLAALF
jgi:hypothetical protein